MHRCVQHIIEGPRFLYNREFALGNNISSTLAFVCKRTQEIVERKDSLAFLIHVGVTCMYNSGG